MHPLATTPGSHSFLPIPKRTEPLLFFNNSAISPLDGRNFVVTMGGISVSMHASNVSVNCLLVNELPGSDTFPSLMNLVGFPCSFLFAAAFLIFSIKFFLSTLLICYNGVSMWFRSA